MADFIEPTPGAPKDFPFAEKIAALKIGLSEQDMRELRNARLKLDVDFRYHKKAVFLSLAALKKIAPELGVQLPNQMQGAAIAEQPDPIPDAVVKLMIVRADLPNKRMLTACAPEENPDRPKKTLRVRVRSQEGFRIRTAIEARLVPGYSDLYDLVSKYPRKKPTL